MTDEVTQQEAPETPAPEAPEKTTYQLIFTKYDDGDAMHREGVPSKDPVALTEKAVELLRRYDVREVFLVTVHASFGKEILIKKLI